MPEVMVKAFKCERCEHIWMPRSTTEGKPTICPKCKSPYWDKPRRFPKEVAETMRKFRGTKTK